MDIGRIPLFEAIAKRMSWLTARQTVLAENVANANTPGYTAKDLKEPDFGSMVQQPTGPLQLAATQPGHLAPIVPDYQAQMVNDPGDKSLDGNGVSLEAQMMKVSSNAANYALVATLYKDNVAMIKTALGGSASG